MLGAALNATRLACAGLSLLLLGGCSSPDDPEPPSDDDCEETTTAATPVDGALEIGTLDGSFRPYTEGESAQLIRGPQGGYMLLPSFRIDAARLGSDKRCAILDITPTVAALATPSFHLTLPEPHPGSEWIVSNFAMFLGLDLDELAGQPCRITASVSDDGHVTTSEVGVVLTWTP